MNARAIIPLVAGLGIGGLALKLGINVLQNAKGASSGERVPVWSARVEIPRGTAITAEMLNALGYPQDVLPPGAFKEKDKDKLVGRVARLVVPANLPVLENMLAPPGALAGVFPKPGFRAVAVKIDESSGVDFHLEPGCFVDVLGGVKDRKGNSATARLVVENVEVAAVGDKISPAEKPAEGGGKSKEKPRPVRAVTLYVRPDQAKKLLLAEQEGPSSLRCAAARRRARRRRSRRSRTGSSNWPRRARTTRPRRWSGCATCSRRLRRRSPRRSPQRNPPPRRRWSRGS